MPRSIILTNHKGGVGKSTSAANIAIGIVSMLKHFGAPNSRVLLIDTDSQAHASLITTGRHDFGAQDSLYTVLMADRKNAPQVMANCIVGSTWDPNLHVLPGSTLLDDAERELMGVAGAPFRIADPLNHLASHYAAIVIDTRPSFTLMTEMGLLAATDAIIPVEPRYLETVGLLSVIQKVNEIREGWRHPALNVRGILVTKMDKRIKGHEEMLTQLKSHQVLGNLICGVIPQNEAVSYSHHNHLSLFHYEPKAAATKAYGHVVSGLLRQMFSRKEAQS